MAKKKHKPGQSGNPAKRAQQDALSSEAVLPGSGGPLTVDMLTYYDDAAHEALTARGWVGDRTDGDLWEWSSSEDEPDHDTETYYEATHVVVNEDGLKVYLAGPAEGPFNLSLYDSIDKLLGDIDALESFRRGDPFPDLAHAVTTKRDASSPALPRHSG